MSPNKLQPALLGGVFIGVLSALPMISAGNLCCCLWVIAGGMLASYVMQQNHPEPIAVTDGTLVGLLSGVVGAVVYLVVSVPVLFLLGPLQRQMLQRIVDNQDLPSEMRDAVQQLSFGVAGLIVGFVFMAIVGVVFASLGGTLGAVLFRKKVPPLPPPSSPRVDVLPPLPPPL